MGDIVAVIGQREVDVEGLWAWLLSRMEPMDFLSAEEDSYARPAREQNALAAALHFGARQPVKLFFSRREAELDRLQREIREDPRIGCRKGCSACCHYHTVCTPAEILELAGYLRAALPAAMLSVLIEHVRCVADQVRPLSAKERWERRIPCALLSDEGACLGYKHRPVICRTYNGVDGASCEAVPPGAMHRGRVDIISHGVGMSRGIGDGCLGVGVDGNPLELTIALEIALTVPDAEARWLRGEEVFRPAWIVDAETGRVGQEAGQLECAHG